MKEKVEIMQTPYEYKKLIKQRILTEQIIMECICRVNERIKNCQDKLQKYKNVHYFDYPYHIESYIERYEKQIVMYSSMKNELLSIYYSDFKIKQINDDFQTFGMQTANLLSVQFVNKVLSLIKSGNYTYQKSNAKKKEAKTNE